MRSRPGNIDGREFQTKETCRQASARETPSFSARIDPRPRLPDAERNRIGVETAGQGKPRRFGIAFDKWTPGRRRCRAARAAPRPTSSISELMLRIRWPEKARSLPSRRREMRYRRWPAGHIEAAQNGALSRRGRIERVDHQVPFPDPVQTRPTSQIVHQVVALCHAVKHVVSPASCLFAQGGLPEAKMRGCGPADPSIFSPSRRPIARLVERANKRGRRPAIVIKAAARRELWLICKVHHDTTV